MYIAISKQSRYQLDEVKAVITDFFGHFSLEKKLAESKTVLIKPNLLGAYEPERAVTTHPVVLEAVIQILLEYNKEIWLGDSPGGSMPVKAIWEKTGIKSLCEKYGVNLINFNTGKVKTRTVNGEEYTLAESFFAADAVINVAKYKTHSLMNYTGCIKNLYGLVPGLKKSDYHSKYPGYEDFARVITDIYSVSRNQIKIHILDGITGMEGEGPSAGEPRDFGTLFASESGAALDKIAAEMLGFNPEQLAYIYNCISAEGISASDIVTDNKWQGFQFEDVKIRKVSQMVKLIQRSPKFMQDLFRSIYKFYPAFNDNCKLCGVCRDSCPVQAITITKGEKTPKIDYEKCIKCMCCHELCPYQAVYIHKSLLARFLVK